MTLNYKAIIFDLDGTLLNTLDDLMDSVNEMLMIKGYPEISYEQTRSFVGNGMMKLVERSLPHGLCKNDVLSCYDIFCEHYKVNMENKTAPYDGIREVLQKLKELGVKTVVTSNKNDDAVKTLCGKIFGNLLTDATGVKENVPPKPDPTMVINAISALGLKKEECLFVGDADTDILTAKNAGLTSLGVLWGFRDRDVLEASGADRIISIPQEIVEFVIN